MSSAAAPSISTRGVSDMTLQARSRQNRGWAHFWLEFMFWWTRHFPRAVLWTKPFFLWFAWRTSRPLRENAIENAHRLLGPGAGRAECVGLAKRVISNLYLSVYDLGESARVTPDELRERIDSIDGKEHYFAARRMRKGAVLVTAHLGSFEMGVAALLDQEKRIHLVFRRDEYPQFETVRSRVRRQLGVIEAPVDEGWSIWVRLRNALLANEVVMIQGDRVMPGQRGVRVPFLGGHIQMPTGPIKLAIAAGAPIIPVFCVRTGIHRVRVIIEPAIEVSEESKPEGGDPVYNTLLKLADAIGRQVAANPDQWLMVERIWCEEAN